MDRWEVFKTASFDAILGFALFVVFLLPALGIDRITHFLHLEDPVVVSVAEQVARIMALMGGYGALRVTWTATSGLIHFARHRRTI